MEPARPAWNGCPEWRCDRLGASKPRLTSPAARRAAGCFTLYGHRRLSEKLLTWAYELNVLLAPVALVAFVLLVCSTLKAPSL